MGSGSAQRDQGKCNDKGDEVYGEYQAADVGNQGAVHGFIQPHQIVILFLPAGTTVAVTMLELGIQVLDPQNVIGSGDIGKQCNDDEANADHMQPSRPAYPAVPEIFGPDCAAESDQPQQRPDQIQRGIEVHSFLR